MYFLSFAHCKRTLFTGNYWSASSCRRELQRLAVLGHKYVFLKNLFLVYLKDTVFWEFVWLIFFLYVPFCSLFSFLYFLHSCTIPPSVCPLPDSTSPSPSVFSIYALCLCKQVPHQLGALTFYRYEQPIVDYCQAHQPLRLNMGYEGPPQGLEGLEDLGPCDRGTIQTVALPAVPSAASIGAPVPGPRSPPPPLRPPAEGPSSGPFPPVERTGTLKFGR